MRLSARKLTYLSRVWDYLMSPRPTRPAPRRPRSLGMESLEGRDVPSVAYDPTLAFNPASNTSGPWQYGSAATLTGAFTPGSAVAVAPTVNAWGESSLPVVFHNPSAADVQVSTILLHAGELAMHPGANGEYAAVRFTAPETADYTITASFAGRDSNFGGTDAHVLRNGVEVFGAEVPAGGVGMSAPLTISLTAGDVIDFRVGYGANHTYNGDSTALAATVTQHDGPYTPPAGGASPPTAADAFSPLSNTNGAWSFGYEPAGGGVFTGGTRFDPAPGVVGWGDTTGDNLPGAFKNLTSQSQTIRTTAFLEAGELGLHPGMNGEWAVARYTAAVSGAYTIGATFAGRDDSFGGTDAHIRVNGVELFGAEVTNNTGVSTQAPISVYMAAGDVVEFAVGRGANGTYFNDTTSLSAEVLFVAADKASIKTQGVMGKALIDEINAAPEPRRTQIHNLFKNFGVDLTVAEQANKWANSPLIYGVKTNGALRVGGVATGVRLSVDGFDKATDKDKAYIVQTIETRTKFFDADNKLIGDPDLNYILEGFAVDDKGVARTLDIHLIGTDVNFLRNGKTVARVEITRDFVASWGYVKNTPAPTAANPFKEFYNGATPPDPATFDLVTLTGTTDYQVKYTLDANGKWFAIDDSASTRQEGVDNEMKKD